MCDVRAGVRAIQFTFDGEHRRTTMELAKICRFHNIKSEGKRKIQNYVLTLTTLTTYSDSSLNNAFFL